MFRNIDIFHLSPRLYKNLKKTQITEKKDEKNVKTQFGKFPT